jgi:dienelactone hydrolase
VRAEAVSYASQFGTRIPAILYLPDPLPKTANARVPAFIVVNGHGGDKYSWYAYYSGILYARAGAAVLAYDPIGEGERNAQRKSGTRAHDQIKGDEQLARRLAGLLMTDVMQAVSYLSQRPEVDAQRIAAGGYSLGSFVLALTGAVEPRLRACVLVGGGNLDEPDGYWDNSKPMCQGLPYRSLNFLGDRPAAIYALHAARGPTLIFNGTADTVVAIPRHGEPFFAALRERTTRLRGSSEGVFDIGMVEGASHRPFFVTRPVALWLERQLDFPRWTEADIRELPETRIGDWAEKHAVVMDKLYATEEREGGTRALLDDVPGFQREDLSVFTAADWETCKEQFVLESWLAKARAASTR